MKKNAHGQSDRMIFKSTISLEQNDEKKADFLHVDTNSLKSWPQTGVPTLVTGL